MNKSDASPMLTPHDWSNVNYVSSAYRLQCQLAHLKLSRMRYTSKFYVANDKSTYLRNLAVKAARAAEDGECKTGFLIVRKLAGNASRSSNSVKNNDGVSVSVKSQVTDV